MIGEWFRDAWEMYKKNALDLAVIVIIAMIIGGIAVAATILGGVLLAIANMWLGIAISVILGGITFVLVLPYVQAVLLSAYVDAAEGKNVDIGKVLSSGKEYWKDMFVVMLLMFVAIGVPLIVGVLGGAMGIGAGLKMRNMVSMSLGALALIVLGIVALYFWIRLVWAPILVIRKKKDGMDAIRTSWEITEKDIGTALAYVGARIVVGIIGGIVAVIPFVGPFISTLVVAPYGGVLYARASKDALKGRK